MRSSRCIAVPDKRYRMRREAGWAGREGGRPTDVDLFSLAVAVVFLFWRGGGGRPLTRPQGAMPRPGCDPIRVTGAGEPFCSLLEYVKPFF